MPVKALPANPNLNHLKYQAKDLLKACVARDMEAAQRIREFHPRFAKASDAEIFKDKLGLSDAQLTIAREHGFSSWINLKRCVEQPSAAHNLNLPFHERIADPAFRRAVELLDAGDAIGLQAHLEKYPNLTKQTVQFEGGNYFRNPALLEFVAENPVRHGTLPANIVEITKIILEAGAKQNLPSINETLGLVCSGRVPREANLQIPLIDLLCDYDAASNHALMPALVHGEFDAANALIRRGAQITLPAAAALGWLEDFKRLFRDSEAESRHQAFALASQFGRTEIVQELLAVGEDPNRYNPFGLHSHSTPLHQAALAGHMEIVRLLVAHGARLDIKDTLWHGTPLDWAKHARKAQIEVYLLEQQNSKNTGNESPSSS